MKLNVKEIKRRISLAGMSEQEFAKKNGFPGQLFYLWLRGQHYPQFPNRLKLAKALNCNIEDIEIEDEPVMMFGDAKTTIKAFCAAVEHEMVSRTKLTEIICDKKDCPFRAADGFYCNAKQLFIENGKCSMTKYKKMMEVVV